MKVKLYRSADGDWVIKGDREFMQRLTSLLAVVRDESPPDEARVNLASRIYRYFWAWNKLYNHNHRDLSEGVIEIKGEMVGRLNGTNFDDFEDVAGKKDLSCYHCGKRLTEKARWLREVGTEEDPHSGTVCPECGDAMDEGLI
jgi:hypothetical protein